MKKKEIGRLAGTAALTAGLLAFWPAGCAPALSGPVSTRSGGPESLRAPARGVTSFLPHPAFAHAAGDGSSRSIADIANVALPSVVNIASRKAATPRVQIPGPFDDPLFRRFFGPGAPTPREQRGLGSGVVVSKEGLVLTNSHVVDGADEIKVTTSDGQEFEGEVVGSDEKSDIAVLRLKGDASKLKPIEFGDSSALRLGDVVLAIGNPFGVGQTVTMGIVSAKGRANVGIAEYEDFIQTDAAINPGNSGGALVSMDGKLVGINTAILSRSGGYQGIGFAIPTNMAHPILESLIEHGKVVRGYLGVGIQNVDEELSRALGLATKRGVLISDVRDDGPAKAAGLRRGDVIVRVGDTSVDSTGALRNAIASAGASSKVKLGVVRDGKTLALDVMLAELPGGDADAGSIGGAAKLDVLDGLTLGDLDVAARKQLGIDAGAGVGVRDVAPGSAAARAGLRPGDVILEVNRKPARSIKEFKTEHDKAKDRVLLLVHRDGSTLFVVLKR